MRMGLLCGGGASQIDDAGFFMIYRIKTQTLLCSPRESARPRSNTESSETHSRKWLFTIKRSGSKQ